MTLPIHERSEQIGEHIYKVLTFSEAEGYSQLEVWPGIGFNALSWKVRLSDGKLADLLYKDPAWHTHPVPTRSGHPILFPFPNRLEHGRFTHEGREYQLRLTDSTNTHAIHGFTPRIPWRVNAGDTNSEAACLTGEFTLSKDLPDSGAQWPTDFTIQLEYQLQRYELLVNVHILNPHETDTFPFGLGFHPYFIHPLAPTASADDLILKSVASAIWEADKGIPTGRRLPVSPELDFRTPRVIGSTKLDTYFTDLSLNMEGGFQEVAALGHPEHLGVVSVQVKSEFGELVLFIPPHRQAIAIEPYTCAANAANLQSRGIDAGWRTLPPRGQAKLQVRYEWQPERKL